MAAFCKTNCLLPILILFSSISNQISSKILIQEKDQPFFNSKTLSVLCYTTPGSPTSNQYRNLKNSGRVSCPIPISQLKAARYEIVSTGDYYTEPPRWFNETLATIGQNFMRKNYVGFLYFSGMTSLLVGTSADVRRVIASAGNIMRPKAAAKRYLGTILNTLFWTNGEIGSGVKSHTPDAYRWNQSSLFETLNLIRTIHETVAHQAYLYKKRYSQPVVKQELDRVVVNEPLWKAFQEDLTASRLVKFKDRPIFPPRDGGTEQYFNQFGMVLQYWAYTAIPIMYPESALLVGQLSEEELLGYLHFWGFLAHVMGLSIEYNICLQPDIPTARLYFRQFLEEYLVPALFHLDYETKVVIEVSAKAFGRTFPFVDHSFLLKQIMEDVLKIQTTHVQRAMPRQARMYTSFLKNMRFLMTYPRSNAAVRFTINGMIQVSTIEQFGFNILRPKNFTEGLIDYNELVLDSVNLWQWRDKAKPTEY